MNNDIISRQALLDAVDSVDWYSQNENGEMVHGANPDEHQAWYKAEDIYKAIESVPSAQPTDRNGQERTGTDLISRQAAIDTAGIDEEIRCEMCKNPMHTDRGCDGNCKYDEILYEKIIQILNKRITPLPSAQPERKNGRWEMKPDPFGIFGEIPVCSECGCTTKNER